MNNILIKDLITLLSVDQVKGNIRKRQAFGSVLLSAAICDLIVQNKLLIEQGKIIVLSVESDDEVLKDISGRLFRYSGKKLSWFLQNQKDKVGGIIRKQMKYLEAAGMIAVRRVSFLGVKTGNRYRVIKPDKLNPFIRSCDRILLYGRRPGIRSAIMIPLLRIMGLMKVYYPEKEYRKRAQQRAGEILKSSVADNTGGMGLVIRLLRGITAGNNITT